MGSGGFELVLEHVLLSIGLKIAVLVPGTPPPPPIKIRLGKGGVGEVLFFSSMKKTKNEHPVEKIEHPALIFSSMRATGRGAGGSAAGCRAHR